MWRAVRSGYDTFITSAGVIGPLKQVDHDISLLIPEVWSRMREEERSAAYLLEHGFLEKCGKMTLKDGSEIDAQALGYRITNDFVKAFFGRVFANPSTVFDEDILKPELQDPATFKAGVKTITDTNVRVATYYIEDGGADMAVPPLKALLHIMAKGEYEGMTLDDPKFRGMWTKEAVLSSEWYRERLVEYQKRELERLERGLAYLETYVGEAKKDWKGQQIMSDLKLDERMDEIRAKIKVVQAAGYIESMKGSIGVDPHIFKAEGSNIDKPLPLSRTH
eukprot:3383204-Rhodomonas_salina.1